MNDFYGKFWILINGDIIDCSTSEHARHARAFMLQIPSDDICKEIPMKDIFKPLTANQFIQYRDRGLSVEQDAVTFLRGNGKDPVDPRVYCIEKFCWIRTVENKFYAWDWNRHTVLHLRYSDEFWKAQPKTNESSVVELIGIKTNSRQFVGTLAKLKEVSLSGR